jgi:GT2 family glycosyltransferase
MDLDIIIVSTNQKKYLKRCLPSLFKSTTKKLNVIVVDNNSSDGTSKFLRKKFPVIKLIINKKKEGFAHNCNLGIKQSESNFVMLLNPDTVMVPGAIEKLYFFLKKHPKVGICGPQLRFPNGQIQMSCRKFPTWKTAIVRRSPFRRFFINSKENKHHLGYDVDHSKTQSVDWLLGACMLIRKKTIEDIGLFDEKYYLYVDDIDYCYRAWKKGWEVWYVPDSLIIHHHLAESDKKLLSIFSWYHLKSMWWYFRKHMFNDLIRKTS